MLAGSVEGDGGFTGLRFKLPRALPGGLVGVSLLLGDWGLTGEIIAKF